MKAEELFGLSQDRLAELRKAYQQSDEKGYWRKVLEFWREASKHPRKFGSVSGYGWCDYMQNADVAAVFVRLGDFDAAFDSLRKGYEDHEAMLIYLKVEPTWDALRSDRVSRIWSAASESRHKSRRAIGAKHLFFRTVDASSIYPNPYPCRKRRRVCCCTSKRRYSWMPPSP
jgi:hypothetical protein